MTSRLPAWALLALLTLVLAIGACRREAEPEPVQAAGDPVAAVQGLAQALRDNDLARYSRLSLPPALRARTEALWNQRVAEAEPLQDQDAEQYDRMMAKLTAPDAEAELMRDLEPHLTRFEAEVGGQWPMMQATAAIFLNAAIQANAELSASEKSHATAVVSSLLAWAQPALFTDRERAAEAISVLVDTAAELNLPTLDQVRALPMAAALEKGGVALAGLKATTRAYDLDLDRSLDGVQTELLSVQGDNARVKVSYPLLDQTVSFEMEMLRRNDAWYSAEAVREAEAELAEAAPTSAAANAG